MLTVDDRTGSNGLFPLLSRAGIPAVLGRIAFGDISFMGRGEGGSPVTIGVEVKQVSDVLKCITDGRFAGHQLPGLIESYDQIWLLIVGLWRSGMNGVLQTRKGKEWHDAATGMRRFMYADLATWLLTIQTRGGIGVVRCTDWNEATLWLSSLYNWWHKGIDDHKSHLALHNPNGSGQFSDRAILSRPSILRMVAAQLPGIGFEKSAEVARLFETVENLAMASVADLQMVPGIGKTVADRIYKALRES